MPDRTDATAPGSGPVQRERRDPQQQAPIADGRRSADPRLSTRDCADTLGVSPKFILGEILDGRLPAVVLTRPGLRRMFRVRPCDLDRYIRDREWSTAAGPR